MPTTIERRNRIDIQIYYSAQKMVFKVNESSSAITVYDYYKNKIGSINPKESCVYGSGDGDPILFLNSAGVQQNGFLWNYSGGLTNWINKPWTITEGKRLFKARYDMPIYNPSGEYRASVKAGEYVWTDTSITGETHKDWLLIRGYRDFYTKEWKTIDGSYGFVDTGIFTYGSGAKYIGIYGSWGN